MAAAAARTVSPDTAPRAQPHSTTARNAVRLAVAAIVLLALAGGLGWVLMGPALFYEMATGLGWLCM
ncbi:MAG: hypothetical protein H6884_07895 [Rhodobiaceae bacterium]|nr:hypothetical protein [Rhodobiaceae bacterium]MCC0053965.1 hypothetical protein [Rhodobiaceae bacterium]